MYDIEHFISQNTDNIVLKSIYCSILYNRAWYSYLNKFISINYTCMLCRENKRKIHMKGMSHVTISSIYAVAAPHVHSLSYNTDFAIRNFTELVPFFHFIYVYIMDFLLRFFIYVFSLCSRSKIEVVNLMFNARGCQSFAMETADILNVWFDSVLYI
jgi:hypothetical protein